MNTKIEATFELLPFLGIIIVAAGIIKQYLYYKVFKIRVLSFLTIDEVLISFADNLLAYFIILLLSMLTMLSFINNTGVPDDGTIQATWPIINRLWHYIRENWTILAFIVVCNIAMVVFGKLRANIYRHEIWLSVAFLWLMMFVLPIIFFEIQELFGIKLQHHSALYLILIIFSLLMYSAAAAYNEAYKVKSLKYFSGSEFETDQEEIISDESFYYVGQSKKFIFFFDALQSRAEIFPIEKIQAFKFIR